MPDPSSVFLNVLGWVVKPVAGPLYERIRDRFVIDLDPDRERATKIREVQKLELLWRRKVGGEVPALLDWSADLVGRLIGREKELAELERWAEEGEAVRARLVVGEGGTGKTRLAAELAQRYRDSGWKAGFANLSGNAPLLFPVPALSRGTLILVDSPEELRERVKELLDGAPRSNRHVRILLLTRRDLVFWEQQLRAKSTAALFDSQAIYLEPPDDGALVELFQAAVRELPGRLEPPRPPASAEGVVEKWLAQDAVHRRPLFVLAAALSHVLEPEKGLENLSAAEVLHALVVRERRQLAEHSEQAGLLPEVLPRLVALAAIAGGLDIPLLKSLAQRDDVLEIGCPPGKDLVRILRSGGHLGSGAPRLPALRPDLFAAAFLHHTLRNEEQAPEWIWAVLEPSLPASLEAFTRLSLLEVPYSHPARWLAQAVADAPQRARALQPWLDREHLSIALQEVAVAADRSMLAAAPNAVERARRLTQLANRLAALGNIEEALAASEEAACFFRQLAPGDSEALQADLAASLANLAIHLSALGRRDEALAASEDAVRIRRQLAAEDPATFQPDLAGSLNSLSGDLSALGLREEALAASEDAASLYRQLAEAQPETFLPYLAKSLSNLGVHFSTLGRGEEALAASGEAASLFRQLAAARPEAFLQDMANSFNSLGKRFSALGRREEALAAIEESVSLYRQLAAARPEAFEPDLAMSLNNLGIRFSALGRREEALAVSEEAVSLFRQLAAAHPEAFQPDLARSLSVLSDCYEALGRVAEALEATVEAARLLLPFYRAQPAAFGDLMTAIADRYLRRADAAGGDADPELGRKLREIAAGRGSSP